MSRRSGVAFAGWTLFTFALPLFLAYLAATGLPPVDSRFWPVWGFNCVLNLGALYLFLSVLRDGELGFTYPLLAITPLFVVPVEWVALGVLPGRFALVGIFLIVLGVYLLNFQGLGPRLTDPFRSLARDPGAVRMLAVAVLWSVGGTLDRVAVLASSPAFYSVMFAGGLSALFLLVLVVGRKRDSIAPLPGLPRVRLWELVVHGLSFSCMMILQMEALTRAQASYVLSIKRTGSVLAVLLGYLAFRERSLVPRLVGALITVAGAFVLVLSAS